MGHWRQPVLLFILPKKPQEMNDFSSFLAVFFYGLMSQSHFFSSRTVSKIKQAPQQNRDRSFCCGALIALVTRWESVSLTLVCLGLLATSISKFLQRKRL